MKIEKFLPEKKESKHLDCWEFDDSYCFRHQECFDEEEEGLHPLKKQGYNLCLSEASKVEIGLDRAKVRKILIKTRKEIEAEPLLNKMQMPKDIIIDTITDALIAAEDGLIVRKENRNE